MKDPVIWFVAFSPKKKEHWWAREFGHASLFGWTNETWINLDLQRNEVDVRAFYTFDDTNDFLSYLLAHFTVVKFGESRNERSHFFAPITCVSFIKHVLGVRSRALLPDTLFRNLVNNYDAEIVNESEIADRDRGTKGCSTAS